MIDFVHPQTMVIIFSYVMTSHVIEFTGLGKEAIDKVVGYVLGQLFNRICLTFVSRKHEKACRMRCLWLQFVQFTIVLCMHCLPKHRMTHFCGFNSQI